jgi:hypothetical protein
MLIGEWKDGRMDGKGRYIKVSGQVYDGGWRADKHHGFGIMKFENGDVYKGEWKDDKRHGKGSILYKNDKVYDIYDGDWENGKKHGQGKMVRCRRLWCGLCVCVLRLTRGVRCGGAAVRRVVWSDVQSRSRVCGRLEGGLPRRKGSAHLQNRRQI